jgi:Raf kinase inhibitor-like YbhB/YbcL family protein
MTWVYWVVLGIPAGVRELPEGAGGGRLPAGARAGRNDWKRESWGGPCPPIGRHRYYFKLHALDAELRDLESPTAAALQRAMEGHVLAEARLMGTYVKKR